MSDPMDTTEPVKPLTTCGLCGLPDPFVDRTDEHHRSLGLCFHLAEDAKNEAYTDRNLLAIAFVRLAQAHGYDVARQGVSRDGYVALYVNLPTGQVSWHVPAEIAPDLSTNLPYVQWDGHDTSEKRRRLMEFRP